MSENTANKSPLAGRSVGNTTRTSVRAARQQQPSLLLRLEAREEGDVQASRGDGHSRRFAGSESHLERCSQSGQRPDSSEKPRPTPAGVGGPKSKSKCKLTSVEEDFFRAVFFALFFVSVGMCVLDG